MQTIIKQVICPEWGKICVTPYGACPDLSGRSAVRGKRSPQTINPGGVVHIMIGSTPTGPCSVCDIPPRAALRPDKSGQAPHGVMHIKPHSGF